MEFVIRVATESDLPEILHLYQQAGIGSSLSFTLDEARAQLKKLGSYPNYKVYVVVLGMAVVGTYELLIMDNLAKRGLPSAIVEDVAVSPAHQGKGIGRAMMEHALQASRVTGCYKLLLSSNFERTNAHAFYESLGFQRHGFSFYVPLD